MIPSLFKPARTAARTGLESTVIHEGMASDPQWVATQERVARTVWIEVR